MWGEGVKGEWERREREGREGSEGREREGREGSEGREREKKGVKGK